MTTPADNPEALLILNPAAQAIDLFRIAIGHLGHRLGRKELAVHFAMLARDFLLNPEDDEGIAAMPYDNPTPGVPSLVDDPRFEELPQWMKDYIREQEQ